MIDKIFPYLPMSCKFLISGYQDIKEGLKMRNDIHKSHLGVITRGSKEDKDLIEYGLALFTFREVLPYKIGGNLYLLSHPKEIIRTSKSEFNFIENNDLESISSDDY